MSDGQIVPPGQHQPFAIVSEDDHRAWILVGASLGVSFTLVTVVTRILIRCFVNRGWGWDDTLCLVATLLSWIQAALVLASAGAGLGRSAELIPRGLLGTVQQSYFASNIFYIIALDLSKLSVVFFLRRLVARGSMLRTYTMALLGIIPLCTVGFVIATSLQCDLLAPWDIVGDSCPNWFLRWQIHGIVECLIEVAMFAAPLWLVWNLQTGFENKVEVVLPFALRVILIVFTGIRLGSFSSAGFSNDFTLREAPYICWTQAELSYSLIAATIPTARRLMLDFITYYNGGNFNTSGTRTGASNAGNTSNTRGDTFQMKSIRSGAGRKNDAVYPNGTLRSRERGDGEVVSDGDSQEMIIRKDINIRVENELGRQETHAGRPSFL